MTATAAEVARLADEFESEFHCSFCRASPAPHAYDMPPAAGADHWHGMRACDDCHRGFGEIREDLHITIHNCPALCRLDFARGSDVYAYEV